MAATTTVDTTATTVDTNVDTETTWIEVPTKYLLFVKQQLEVMELLDA